MERHALSSSGPPWMGVTLYAGAKDCPSCRSGTACCGWAWAPTARLTPPTSTASPPPSTSTTPLAGPARARRGAPRCSWRQRARVGSGGPGMGFVDAQTHTGSCWPWGAAGPAASPAATAPARRRQGALLLWAGKSCRASQFRHWLPRPARMPIVAPALARPGIDPTSRL